MPPNALSNSLSTYSIYVVVEESYFSDVSKASCRKQTVMYQDAILSFPFLPAEAKDKKCLQKKDKHLHI